MTDVIHKVSAGGVVYHRGKVLTIKWLSKNSIEFPKGAVEPGETVAETSVREVFEETGYKVRLGQSLDQVTFEFDWDDGKRYRKSVYYFLMSLMNDDQPTPNRESNEDFENLWLSPEEASAMLTHDDSKEVLRRAMRVVNDTKSS